MLYVCFNRLLGDWPNTYVFTKAVAEHLIETKGNGLPIAVVRPSIGKSTNSRTPNYNYVLRKFFNLLKRFAKFIFAILNYTFTIFVTIYCIRKTVCQL